MIKNILKIIVEELPLVQNIIYEGIKANRIKDVVFKDLKLKPRSSYNEVFLKDDLNKIKNSLKNLGYYFSEVNISVIPLEDNKIDLIYYSKFLRLYIFFYPKIHLHVF